MKIGFVSHEHPDTAESGAFLVDLLREMGSVATFTIAPAGDAPRDVEVMRSLASSRLDRYVFWHAEDTAAQLLPLNFGPSVLVPRSATAAARADGFWRQFVRHRMIAFARPLHERLQQLSCSTAYFQYFPEPEGQHQVDIDALDAVFEEPATGAADAIALVAKQCRALGVRTLHIRRRPGAAPTGGVAHVAAGGVPAVEGVEVRVFAGPDGPGGVAAPRAHPLFFFAPTEPAEIGAAIIEAMGRGQIVVAPDSAPVNEHVSHLVSGLLYSVEGNRPAFVRPGRDALLRMSEAARRKAETGRRDWLQDADRLTSIIADDGRRWSTLDRSSHFRQAMHDAAHQRAIAHG